MGLKVGADGKSIEQGAAGTTTIVGITGTLAEFNAACTDANFASGGGTATGTNTGDQDLSAYATTAAVAAGYQPLDTQLIDLAALDYATNALKFLRVKATEDGLEWATAGAGSTEITAASVVLNHGVFEGSSAILDAAALPTSRVMLDWGNCLDTDENGPDMDDVTFRATPAAGQVTVRVISNGPPIGGTFKFNYQLAN